MHLADNIEDELDDPWDFCLITSETWGTVYCEYFTKNYATQYV